MTVTETDINMFKLPPDTALVCPVNCRGVMGKGLAKEFRNRYHEIYAQYKWLCEKGKVHPGEPFVLRTFKDDRTVVMFPTKDDWRDPSKEEWITAGLQALPELCREKKITSIAIPPVGAGLGGLDPAWVKGQVQALLSNAPDLNVTYTAFAPKVSQSNIEVCNLHNKSQQPTNPWDVRLDRGYSVLANPNPMNGDERLRDEVCDSYQTHFENAMEGRTASQQQATAMQAEIQRLKDIYNKYGKLRLFCWCAPARCHCETVRNFLEKDMDLPVTELTPPKQTLDLWTKGRVMKHVDNSNGAYPDMPKEFWFEGDLSLLDTPCVAMVGNRDLGIDDELAVQARSAAELLAKSGVTVLSGLAEGSDSISMKAAHEAGGKVIAFSPYPVRSMTMGKDRMLAEKILEEGGLVVKFSLEQDRSFGQMAAQRDRYMAEKAQSVLVVKCTRPLEDGTRFAAVRAKEINKPLYILDDKRNFIAQKMFEAKPLERDPETNTLDASVGAICVKAKEDAQAADSQPRSKPLISDAVLADANEMMDEPIPVRKVQYKPPRTIVPRNVTVNFDRLDISPALKNRFIQDGYRYMSKAQAKAIADILSGNNVLAALPTSAGKSLIGEIAMLSDVDPFGEKWASNKGEGSPLRPKAMYIVPTKALATEKVEELIHLCGEKRRVAMASSDSDDVISSDVDLLVATAEKADSMLRHQDRWLCGLTTVVADEIHTIADPDRGAIYEATIISFKHMPGVRVVGLSGTVPNDKQMSAWLSAERTTDDARRSKLRVAVYDQATNSLVYDTPDDSLVGKDKNILRLEGKGLASSIQQTVALTQRAVSSGKQVIVFVLSRKSADSVAQTLRDAGINAEAHHAGLTKEERHTVEQTYKDGKIRCIVSTPTLAMGVNMPAETVIIKDLAMFDPQLKMMVPLPKSMVHQMAGRAGRGNTDGEAYLLPYEGGGTAESRGLVLNTADIERMYMYSASENVQSYLFGRADDTLERAVLGMYGQGQDPYILMDSFSRYTTAVTDEARQREIELATNSLIERGMLAYDGRKITLTEFGRVTANLCIRPTTAVALRDMCRNLPQWMEVYAGPAEQPAGPYDTTPLDRRLMGVIAQCAELKGTAGGDREQKTNWARLLRQVNMDVPEYYGDEDRQRTAYLLAGAMYLDKESFLDGMIAFCGVYAPDFTDKVDKAKWLAHAAVLISDVVNPKVTGYLLNIEPRLHNASAWLSGATYDDELNIYRDNLAKRGFNLNHVLNPSKWDKVDGSNDGALAGEYVQNFSWYIPSGVDTPPTAWPPEAVGVGGWDRITDDYVRRKCDTAPAGDRTLLNTKVPRYIQSVINGVKLNNGDELEREVYQSIADWYNSLDPVYKNVMGKTLPEQNRLNYVIGDKIIPKVTYRALEDGFTRALMYATMRKNTGKKKDSFFGDVDGNSSELTNMLAAPELSVQEAHKEYDESQKAAQDREADVQAHYKKRNGFIARKRRDYGLEYVPQSVSTLITPQDKPPEPARIFLTPARGEYLNTDVLVDTLIVDDDMLSTAGVIDHEASGHKFRFGLNIKSLDAATAGKRKYTNSVISAYLGQTKGNRLTFGTTVWNTLATGAIVVTALRKKDMSPADWMVFRRSIIDGIKSLPAKYGVQSVALPRGSDPRVFQDALSGYDLYIWDPDDKLAGKGYPVVNQVDNDRLSPIEYNADRRENSFKSQINIAGSNDPLVKALSKYGDTISSMDETNPKENLLKALNGLNPAGSKRIALTGLNQLAQNDPRIPEIVNFINQSVGSTIICTVPPEGCTPIEDALAAHGNVILMVGNWPDLRGHRALIDALLDHNWENPAGCANAVLSMPISRYTDVSKKGGKEVRTRLDEVPVALATDVVVAACDEPYSAKYHSLYMDSGKDVTVLPGNKGLFRRVRGAVETPAPVAPETLSPGALVTLTLENLGKSPEKIASFAEFCGHDPALAMNQVMALPGAQEAYAKAVQRLTQLNSRGAHVLTVFDKGFDRRWSHNEVDPRVHLTYMGNLSLLNGVRAAADGSDHLFDTEEDERSIREENHAYSRALGSYMQALTTPIGQHGAYNGVIATGTHSSGAAAAREAIYRTRGKQIRYLDVPIEDLMDLAGPDSALMWLVKNARFKDPTVQAEFDAQGKRAEDLTAADQKRLYSLSLAGEDGELDPSKIFGVDIETGNTQTDGTAEYTSVGGRSAQAFRLLCYSLDKKREALMNEAKAKRGYNPREKRPEVPKYMEFEFNGTNKIMLPVHPTYTYTDLLTDSIALHQATDDGNTLLLAPTTYSSDLNQWTPADSLEDTMVAASDQMIMAGSNKKRHLEWNAKGPMLLIPVSQNNRVEGGADMSTLMYGGKDFYLFKENEYDEEEIQNERGAIKIKNRGADSGVLSDWANAAYYGNTTMDALFPDLDDQC